MLEPLKLSFREEKALQTYQSEESSHVGNTYAYTILGNWSSWCVPVPDLFTSSISFNTTYGPPESQRSWANELADHPTEDCEDADNCGSAVIEQNHPSSQFME